MEKRNPIVYIIGVEGHFYQAEALKIEFGRPIVAIMTSERMHEILTPERHAIFDRIYSLPDFYLENIGKIAALSFDELNKKQQELEKSLSVKNTALLTNIDRRIRALGDLRKVRNWQICNLMFLKEFFKNEKPAFVLDGVITFLQLALRDICEE